MGQTMNILHPCMCQAPNKPLACGARHPINPLLVVPFIYSFENVLLPINLYPKKKASGGAPKVKHRFFSELLPT